jgi:hypothetical protein
MLHGGIDSRTVTRPPRSRSCQCSGSSSGSLQECFQSDGIRQCHMYAHHTRLRVRMPRPAARPGALKTVGRAGSTLSLLPYTEPVSACTCMSLRLQPGRGRRRRGEVIMSGSCAYDRATASEKRRVATAPPHAARESLWMMTTGVWGSLFAPEAWGNFKLIDQFGSRACGRTGATMDGGIGPWARDAETLRAIGATV